MRAMGRAERVVNINVSDLGQLLGKGRVIRLLLVVIPHVLQQQHIARLHHADRLLDLRADAVVGKRNEAAQQIRQFLRHRAQGQGRLTLAFGSAQVRRQDQLCAPLDHKPERRQGLHDAGRVVDDHLAVFLFHRYVVIHAHKHAFAANVQISNGQFCHKISSSRLGAQSLPKRCNESNSIRTDFAIG